MTTINKMIWTCNSLCSKRQIHEVS